MSKFKVGDVFRYKIENSNLKFKVVHVGDEMYTFYNLKTEDNNVVFSIEYIDSIHMLDEEYMKLNKWNEQLKEIIDG